MKRDGRGFDHRTLEAIRLMAVEREGEGERPSSVVASFGFSRTTISKWISTAAAPGLGLKALHSDQPPSRGPGEKLVQHDAVAGADPVEPDELVGISGPDKATSGAGGR